MPIFRRFFNKSLLAGALLGLSVLAVGHAQTTQDGASIGEDLQYEVLFNFAQSPSRSAEPLLMIQAEDGNLYGTTHISHNWGAGWLFRISHSGHYEDIYQPKRFPIGGVVQAPDGQLYGAGGKTVLGDDRANVIYRLTLDGVYTELHRFIADHKVGTDINPPTVGADGALYGATCRGGPGGMGVLYRLALDGDLKVLQKIQVDGHQKQYCVDGALAAGQDGRLYGVARVNKHEAHAKRGLNQPGIFFSVGTQGPWALLQTFHNHNGIQSPVGPLALSKDGNFYGRGYGLHHTGGRVFKLTPAGHPKLVRDFSGYGPSELLAHSNGRLYGVTQSGGAYGHGLLFSMTRHGELTVLHDFGGDQADGQDPQSGLTLGSDGWIYGNTSDSASYFGTVFRFKP